MKNSKTLIMIEGAIMIALATVLSFIRIYNLPWGGSITLLSMFPIVMFSIRRGLKNGLTASFLYSVIQFGQGIADGLFGWPLSPTMLIACIFLDYIFAYSVIGVAGIFRNFDAKGWIAGTVTALSIRFLCHFLSGAVIFKSFGQLWDGFSTENVWLYSFIYNGSYMFPEILITSISAFLLFRIPQTRKLLKIS